MVAFVALAPLSTSSQTANATSFTSRIRFDLKSIPDFSHIFAPRLDFKFVWSFEIQYLHDQFAANELHEAITHFQQALIERPNLSLVLSNVGLGLPTILVLAQVCESSIAALEVT